MLGPPLFHLGHIQGGLCRVAAQKLSVHKQLWGWILLGGWASGTRRSLPAGLPHASALGLALA